MIFEFIKKIYNACTAHKIVKRSLEHIEGDKYIYTDYYKNGESKSYRVFTRHNYGIIWYDEKTCNRINLSFEDLLERMFNMLKRHGETVNGKLIVFEEV